MKNRVAIDKPKKDHQNVSVIVGIVSNFQIARTFFNINIVSGKNNMNNMNNKLQGNPLPNNQKTTKAGNGIKSQILCVRYNQNVKPILSVQREFNLNSGIRRGYQDYAGRLMMDHVIGAQGQLLFGRKIRLGTISVWEHQIRHLLEKEDRIIAIVGNGNLTQNPYFIAWYGETGELIRLRNEPIMDRVYDCMVIDPNYQCSIKALRFETNGNLTDIAGWKAIENTNSAQLSSSTKVAFSGQRIVTDGKPLTRSQLNEQVLSGLYYDLRHVFRFPAIKSGNYWKDVGLEQFYDHGSINKNSVLKALKNETTTTRWKDLTQDKQDIHASFSSKSYNQHNQHTSPLTPGHYRLNNDMTEIAYSDAIYSHNVLGLHKNGNLCSMQVTGWSNNVGATLLDLSNLASQIFQNALLLDNGGDVFYFWNNDSLNYSMIPYEQLNNTQWTIVPSCEKRYTIRSVILFVLNKEDTPSNSYVEVIHPKFKGFIKE